MRGIFVSAFVAFPVFLIIVFVGMFVRIVKAAIQKPIKRIQSVARRVVYAKPSDAVLDTRLRRLLAVCRRGSLWADRMAETVADVFATELSLRQSSGGVPYWERTDGIRKHILELYRTGN